MANGNYSLSGLKLASKAKSNTAEQVNSKTVARLNYNDNDTERGEKGGKAKK